MDSTESPGKPEEIYQKKPCQTASLPAAATVIPLKKRLGGICNVDGEPHL